MANFDSLPRMIVSTVASELKQQRSAMLFFFGIGLLGGIFHLFEIGRADAGAVQLFIASLISGTLLQITMLITASIFVFAAAVRLCEREKDSGSARVSDLAYQIGLGGFASVTFPLIALFAGIFVVECAMYVDSMRLACSDSKVPLAMWSATFVAVSLSALYLILATLVVATSSARRIMRVPALFVFGLMAILLAVELVGDIPKTTRTPTYTAPHYKNSDGSMTRCQKYQAWDMR